MTRQDDRSAEQKATLTMLVVGTDSFMSGWGEAAGGTSVAAWACSAEDLPRVERWVRQRGEMKRVRVVRAAGYTPRGNVAHFHIYAVGEDHPALR